MDQLTAVILWTSIAALAMPAGAALASVERLRPRWLENELRHSVIAFGGGALLAAVALVLVPEGVKGIPGGVALGAFLVGGIGFMALDRVLARARSSAAQFVAMLADFIPEALALGASMTEGGSGGVLLALLITLQNLPEGFNASRELSATEGRSPRAVTLMFLLLVPLGPFAGIAGFEWLAGATGVLSVVMLFAAGGIVYLTFQDIAPQAQLKNSTAPTFGAVLGFALGLAGHVFLPGG